MESIEASMTSVGSGHGHEQHRTQQLDTNDETTSVIGIIPRVQSGGAPRHNAIHFELEARFNVFDGNLQAWRQACIQIEPYPRTRNVVDYFDGIGRRRSL